MQMQVNVKKQICDDIRGLKIQTQLLNQRQEILGDSNADLARAHNTTKAILAFSTLLLFAFTVVHGIQSVKFKNKLTQLTGIIEALKTEIKTLKTEKTSSEEHKQLRLDSDWKIDPEKLNLLRLDCNGCHSERVKTNRFKLAEGTNKISKANGSGQPDTALADKLTVLKRQCNTNNNPFAVKTFNTRQPRNYI